MVLTITAKVPTATSTAASLLCTLCRHLICSVIRQLCDTTVADVAVHWLGQYPLWLHTSSWRWQVSWTVHGLHLTKTANTQQTKAHSYNSHFPDEHGLAILSLYFQSPLIPNLSSSWDRAKLFMSLTQSHKLWSSVSKWLMNLVPDYLQSTT